MTYNQLKREVAQLGFERDIEDEEHLLISACRAQQMLFTDRPVKKRVTLYASDDGLSLNFARLHHVAKDVITVKITAPACSFFLSGKGSYTVKSGRISERYDFFSNMEARRHFIRGGEATITFSGDYDYDVICLSSVSVITGDSEDNIPLYKSVKELDVTLGAKDFRAFCSLPTDSNHRPLQSCSLEDGKIFIPRTFEGEILVEYYRAPKKISGVEDEVIDLPPDADFLLPLLTASFLWLDDDASKAQYYLALYNEALTNLTRRARISVNTSYSTNGWA